MNARVVLALAAALGAVAQERPSAPELFEAKLRTQLRAIDDRTSGVLGCSIIDLETGRTIGHNADTVFPQASSIKIPIMMQVYEQAKEGRLRLSDTVSLTQKDAVEGSGHLRLLLRSRPLTLTIGELVSAMIETSDNTATNLLIAMVGIERVNAMLDRLGFRQTRLRRIMLDAQAAARNDENVSTPAEMAKLAELIYRGKAVDAPSSQQMAEILKRVNADFRSVIPPSVPVAAKPGEVTGVRCETGIVYLKDRPFVLSVASSFLKEPENPVPDVARLVFEYFSRLARSNRYGNLGVR